MPGVVRRELGLRVELDAEQVADGVAVLGPVESTDGDPARIRIRRIKAERAALDPVLETQELVRARLRLLRRGIMPARVFLSTDSQRSARPTSSASDFA